MDNQEFEYAGFWARTGASIIDTVLVMLVTIPLLLSIYGWAYFEAPATSYFAGTADFVISWVMPTVAIIAFWVLKQATPGKMLISARIVDARTGQPASTGQLIGRYFAYFVAMLPLFLGIVWVAFDKRKQGWHDKLAGTVVIKKVNSGAEPVRFGSV